MIDGCGRCASARRARLAALQACLPYNYMVTTAEMRDLHWCFRLYRCMASDFHVSTTIPHTGMTRYFYLTHNSAKARGVCLFTYGAVVEYNNDVRDLMAAGFQMGRN
jgi:hypothetical protein